MRRVSAVHRRKAYAADKIHVRRLRAARSGNAEDPQPTAGPCTNGPGADGSCGLRRPPCVPRRTLSVWRGRLSVLAIGFVLALVAILAYKTDATSAHRRRSIPVRCRRRIRISPRRSLLDMSHRVRQRHQRLVAGILSPGALMPDKQEGRHRAASFVGGVHRMHSFEGKEEHPHNRVFEKRPTLGPTDCLMCHTEHKGRLAQITKLSQAQCQSCHTRVIKDFASTTPNSHPNFPTIISRRSPSITPITSTNTSPSRVCRPRCHPAVVSVVISSAMGAGRCSLRHLKRPVQIVMPTPIAKKDFVLLRWPEIDNNDIKPDEIAKSCGASAVPPPPPAGKPAPAFSGVSSDPLNTMTAYLLDTPADSAADYEKPVQDLARDMMANGADPLVDAVGSHLPKAKKEQLFSGLDSEASTPSGMHLGGQSGVLPTGTNKCPLVGAPTISSCATRIQGTPIRCLKPGSMRLQQRLCRRMTTLRPVLCGPGGNYCHLMAVRACAPSVMPCRDSGAGR